jgi:hypothetical protein
MKTQSLIGKALVIAFISLIAISAAEAKGKKYGLFIGINAYEGGINPLKGCVNDATKMREAMTTKFGFNVADTTLLTDAAATRAGILANLNKYATLAGVGDVLVVHYSGHGTLFPDKYSEEQDETKLIYMELPDENGNMEVLYERGTYDSAIVPVDARSKTSGKPWRNLILDDELYAILGGVTRKGAQVVLISDSCHSGSIDRAKKSDEVELRTQTLPAVFGVRRFSDLELEQPTTRATKTLPPAKGLYLTMTGSKDDEFSLDVKIDGLSQGLFTAMFLREVNKLEAFNPKKPITANYEQIMGVVSKNVSDKAKTWDRNQNPQFNYAYGNPKMTLFSAPAGR